MKSSSWTAVVWLAAMLGLLTGTRSAWAEDASKDTADAKRQQEVWDMQVKYATYGAGAVGLALVACWMLSKSDQHKKKLVLEERKRDRLDPNEGMPFN